MKHLNETFVYIEKFACLVVCGRMLSCQRSETNSVLKTNSLAMKYASRSSAVLGLEQTEREKIPVIQKAEFPFGVNGHNSFPTSLLF